MATEKGGVVKEAVFPIYIVDAFTERPFSGNPAAVCLVGNEVQWFLYMTASLIYTD